MCFIPDKSHDKAHYYLIVFFSLLFIFVLHASYNFNVNDVNLLHSTAKNPKVINVHPIFQMLLQANVYQTAASSQYY